MKRLSLTNVSTHDSVGYKAYVTIGEMLDIGKSKHGERRIIPITGGIFKGLDIEGVVVPAGYFAC